MPGFGYRVEKGDRIRIETMIHNPTPTAYQRAYLEVAIPYGDDGSPAPLKNLYPAWMDVGGCGKSGYNLAAGPSKKVGTVPVKYDGVLLGVGGHMHDYAKELVLKDSRSKEPVVTLAAKTDEHGQLIGMPVELFYPKYPRTGGYPLEAGRQTDHYCDIQQHVGETAARRGDGNCCRLLCAERAGSPGRAEA